MSQPLVIKVGGNDLDKPGFIPQFARAVAAQNRRQPCIVVHGGGRAINDLLDRLRIEARYIHGQRVTDEATLRVAEMVLSGSINKQLTLALTEAGADALGLSGVDRGLLRVEPWAAEMGLVGRIVAVRADVLRELCAAGVVPVVSPISAGPDGRYNVNADHAAGAIAGAVGAARVVFVTNVPGVQSGDGVMACLSRQDVHDLIAQGVVSGGMIPKVSAALDALSNGAREAVITDLAGFESGGGTVVVP